MKALMELVAADRNSPSRIKGGFLEVIASSCQEIRTPRLRNQNLQTVLLGDQMRCDRYDIPRSVDDNLSG